MSEKDQNTAEAYIKLKKAGFLKPNNNRKLGVDDNTSYKSPNFKTQVNVWTNTDKQTHTYFHSLSIDVQVSEFMGTAELRCPFDSDLMEYWEPLRATCVIYGANKGAPKILFVGRCREVRQDGYELVVSLQNYGWKFEQNASSAFVNDNVVNKDGYTVMKLIFEALKIDKYVISPNAKKRLKEIGFDENGNVTMNGEEITEIPDLIDRIKKTKPSDTINKYTLQNKLDEDKLNNLYHINYTLKYSKVTPTMSKIAKGNTYSGSGASVYGTTYGGAAQSGAQESTTQNTSTYSPTTNGQPTGGNAGQENVKKWLKSAYNARYWAKNPTALNSVATIYRIWYAGVGTSNATGNRSPTWYLNRIYKGRTDKNLLLKDLHTFRQGAKTNRNWWPSSLGVEPSGSSSSGGNGLMNAISNLFG